MRGLGVGHRLTEGVAVDPVGLAGSSSVGASLSAPSVIRVADDHDGGVRGRGDLAARAGSDAVVVDDPVAARAACAVPPAAW